MIQFTFHSFIQQHTQTFYLFRKFRKFPPIIPQSLQILSNCLPTVSLLIKITDGCAIWPFQNTHKVRQIGYKVLVSYHSECSLFVWGDQTVRQQLASEQQKIESDQNNQHV